MAETKTPDKNLTMVQTIGKRLRPPFTEAERNLAETYVEQGADPVAAAQRVLDGRVAMASAVVRERDGDPYPPLESLLDDDERKARAKAKYAEEFGETGGDVPPDLAREQAAHRAALEEVERLRKEVDEVKAQAEADVSAGLAALEEERQKVKDLEAEAERLRTQGETPPLPGSEPAKTGPNEQTGGLAGSTRKIRGGE